ncbi:protein hinderin isoform X2 [Sinocyclocheilus grahami]|uniref:Protein hinderin-like n=1 Tax=Sinocyclocheilus grahami TaxID=75366 RepID=A0A672M3K2_SINGR|nr:PREDICTED: protein hinderin-like isoform X1 [Sinocyclocheilus grahami]XP_016148382.1 PREDICTED: protein hinderin-like isoform X2 [Sinocyclocheilus grahami]
MASVAEGANGNGFYWIHDKSDEEQPMVFVTGMSKNAGLKVESANNTEGKIKRRASGMDKSRKITGLHSAVQSAEMMVGKASDQKLPSVVAKSKTTTPAPEPDLPSLTLAQPLFSAAQAKSKPSLKDLCPEDKRRIANLIQELARVSEEKDESVQKLRDEQETFEKKIQQLEQQNQLIIQERESLQQQYGECQELLGLYQQYLSQQQEKLNKSITLLNQSCSHSKIPSSEGVARRSWGGRGTALDGSYLDLPSSGSKTDRGGSVECTHSFSTGPFSAPSSSDQNCEIHDRHTNHNSEGGRSDLGFSNREPSACNALRLHGTSEPKCSHQCHRMENDGMCGANRTGIAPLSGRKNWEEKRRCLLLQKKQLEMERERIQARLAQQEEKLLLQNKQLRQSYLQYNKLQQATTTDFERPLNGDRSFNEGQQSSFVMDQLTHRSEIKGESHTLQGNVQPSLSNVQSQQHTSSIEQSAPKISQDISITKKDMATSPVVPQSFQTSAVPQISLFGLPSTPKASRLDDSLIELLDIISPVSNTERYRINPSSRRGFVAPQSFQKTLLSPCGPNRSSLQDLEESEILEDIFFIC